MPNKRSFASWILSASLACVGASCTSNPVEPIAVSISPGSATVLPGNQLQLTATVTGTAITTVSWSVTPLGAGLITQSGLYSAPDIDGTFTVRATSEVDDSKYATATITVGIPLDAGSGDGGESDAGADGGSDAGSGDGGISDAGDGGIADSGVDAGPLDAGTLAFSSFTASPVAVISGQGTTLAWTVSGATSLSLMEVGGAAQTVTGSSLQTTPHASTTYLLTASNGAASITLPASVTVDPAQPAPLIEALYADSSSIVGGIGTTLRWTVVNATQVSISGLGTVAASGSQSILPAATTIYTLTATGTGGSASASATVSVDTSVQLTPVDPGTGDILLTIDSSAMVHPISPYIYGYNANSIADAPPGTTFLREGGNRWTAYNWETNASNAGSDYLYESDDFLGGGSTPAGALSTSIASAKSGSAGLLVTIPTQGWVSADESGPVDIHAPDIDRFFPTAPRKAAAFSGSPDTTDKRVFNDEFAHDVASNFAGASGILAFDLDNEPDLWSSTHAEIEKSPVTYQELFDKSVGNALALKDAVPNALIYGPVSYGWEGFVTLQNASDANNRDFLTTYLQTMEAASRASGRRLLDVLDLHWYSEATGGGVRVTNDDNSAAVVAARVQASRSLWDSSFVEDSWITSSLGGAAIQLLPRMFGKISAAFPGTKLSLSEYDTGGGDDISGTVVQADTLGIFGQYQLYSASYWPLNSNESYTSAAFRLFRDYDGNGSTFGDTSISAVSSDISLVSVYASINAGHPETVIAVIVNRDTADHTARLVLHHSQQLLTSTVWQINGSNQSGSTIAPKMIGSPTNLSAFNGTTLAIPAMSVSTVELK